MLFSKPGPGIPTWARLWLRPAWRRLRGPLRALPILALLLGPSAACDGADHRPALPAVTGSRVALLIGEGDYFRPPPSVHGYFWPKLENPPHDVGLVADKLKEDGFETTVLVNVGRAAMMQAIADFAAKAAKADDAVVYYAGHGFEYARHNYLVPIDAPTQADGNLLAQTFVDLDVVAQAAGKARRANIFFLDACRTADTLQLTGPTKPYVDDVEFNAGTPVAVVYSTARGEPAFDHGQAAPPPMNYSPFAWFVAQYLTLPRTSFSDVFTFVNAKVQQSTHDWGPQAPYMLTSFTAPYYFRPAGVTAPRPPQIAAQTAPAAGGAGTSRGLATSLGLTVDHLAVTDEPVVVADVLADHTADDLARMAAGGDPMAAYLLGYMFEFGRGETRDLAKARMWLEQAATSQLAPAQLELGFYLRKNAPAPADQARARALMEAAAAQGFAKAEAHLADLLMRDGSYADYQRGLTLYRAAAKKNYPEALYALAVLKDADALAQLSALAAKGDMASRQWICDLAGAQGATSFALGDCMAAAKAGYAIAQARLAIAYHDGKGAPADPDEARHWSRLALQQPDLRDDLAKQVQAFGY